MKQKLPELRIRAALHEGLGLPDTTPEVSKCLFGHLILGSGGKPVESSSFSLLYKQQNSNLLRAYKKSPHLQKASGSALLSLTPGLMLYLWMLCSVCNQSTTGCIRTWAPTSPPGESCPQNWVLIQHPSYVRSNAFGSKKWSPLTFRSSSFGVGNIK